MIQLRYYHTFANLSLIFLKLGMNKDQGRGISKKTVIHEVINFTDF